MTLPLCRKTLAFTHWGEHIPIKSTHRIRLAAVGRLRRVGLMLQVGVRMWPLFLLFFPLFPLLDPHQLHTTLLPTDNHYGGRRAWREIPTGQRAGPSEGVQPLRKFFIVDFFFKWKSRVDTQQKLGKFVIDTGPEALVCMTEERAFIPIGWGPSTWLGESPLDEETALLAKVHPS